MDDVDCPGIGSGAGLHVAGAAANRRQSITIVENGPLGGTCLDRRWIPSTMLRCEADLLETVERADTFHIDVDRTNIAFRAIVREVNETERGDTDSIRQGLRSSPRHDRYLGGGRIVDERTVEIVSGEDGVARIRAPQG